MRAVTTAVVIALMGLAACGGDGSTRSTQQGLENDSSAPTAGPGETGSTSAPAAKDAEPAPITSRDRLKGTANPNLGAGEAGEVTVVAVGTTENNSGGTKVPLAVRNRTIASVRAEISAAARDASGAIIASGSDQGTHPGAIGPGEVGLGYVYFDTDAPLPGDTKFDFTVSTTAENGGSFGKADLRLTEVNRAGNKVVGTAVNDLGKRIQGPYSTVVFCFDGDQLIATQGGFATPDADADANATESFSVDLFDRPCPTFLVGVSGYFR